MAWPGYGCATSGVSSGSNRHSINKQASLLRSPASDQVERWQGRAGKAGAEPATRHSPISPFAIHASSWSLRHHSYKCLSLLATSTCSCSLVFIIYVTHSTRILLVDCFAYTCSFLSFSATATAPAAAPAAASASAFPALIYQFLWLLLLLTKRVGVGAVESVESCLCSARLVALIL